MNGLLVGSRGSQTGGLQDVIQLLLAQRGVLEGAAGETSLHQGLKSGGPGEILSGKIGKSRPVMDVRKVG